MSDERDTTGFVYVIQNEDGLCKIGRAKNVEQRLKQLMTGSASALTIVTAWPCEDAAEREAIEHEFWSDCRVRGEWFDIPAHIVAIWRDMTPFYHPRADDEDAWFEIIHGQGVHR